MGTIRTLLCATRESPLRDLRSALTSNGDVALIGEAVTESETVRLAREWHPNVLMLDAASLSIDVGTLSRVNAASPSTKILVFCAAFTEQFVLRALRHGASGCLRLGTSPQEVLYAIRAVHAGELWATRKIVSQAYKELLAAQEPTIETAQARGAQLSPRQLEIVSWMRHGMTNKEIGRRLGISDMTVKTHAHNIFHKLEISGRMHLFGLSRAQQIEAPLEPPFREMTSATLRVRNNQRPRRAQRPSGFENTAARGNTGENPHEPAAA